MPIMLFQQAAALLCTLSACLHCRAGRQPAARAAASEQNQRV